MPKGNPVASLNFALSTHTATPSNGDGKKLGGNDSGRKLEP